MSHRLTIRLTLAAALVLLTVGWAAPGEAQPLTGVGKDVGGLARFFGDLFTELGNKARNETFSFMQTLEFYDVEGEIDRLVGNPWELSDSTSYKLTMFPLRVGYPVYQQLVSQMTRLDELRSMRIYNLTPDSMRIINVNLDILNDQRSSQQLLDSVTQYFTVREILDLGVYGLARMPIFPEDDVAWQIRKHQIALHKGALALTAVSLGMLFEAGAYGRSGRLSSWKSKAYDLGWYGNFSHLGFQMHPLLRGGLTFRMPGLEMAAGWAEQVRPAAAQMHGALEFSLRESYLGRFTGPTGWNSFFQAALRRVMTDGPSFQGERMTGRAGVFTRRERPLFRTNLVLRSSAEVESDFDQSIRFAVSLGLDHARSGVSAVLQSSRSSIVQDGQRSHDMRTALFLAGTMEPPTYYLTEAMNVSARLVRELWDDWQASEEHRQAAETRVRLAPGAPSTQSAALQNLGAATLASENLQLRLGEALADFLEARRRVYALEQWPRSEGDLHGPLESTILAQASEMIFLRLYELTAFLERAPSRLEVKSARYAAVREAGDPAEQTHRAVAEKDWRQESDEVMRAFHLYAGYRDSARRIGQAAPRLATLRKPDPLALSVQRKLIVLCAQSLEE